MSILAIENRFMLPESMHTAVVMLAAAAAVAAWVCSHLLRRPWRSGWVWAAMFLVRFAVGSLALWTAAQAIQRVLVLATSWPIWPIALVGAFCVEVLLSLYDLERRTVRPRTGRLLAGLRVALVLLVALMLTQPVQSLALGKKYRPVVAVLIDDSASMHIPESQLTPSERLRRGEMLGLVERPYRLDEVQRRLAAIRRTLAARHDWVRSVASGPRPGEQLAGRVKAISADLAGALKTLTKQTDAIGAVLTGTVTLSSETKTALTNLKAMLFVRVRGRLEEAAKIASDDDQDALAQQAGALQDSLRQASTALAEAAGKLQTAAEAVDAAYYQTLPAPQRERIDAAGRRTRYDIARQVLLRKGGAGPGKEQADKTLLQRLGETCDVKLLTFAAKTEAIGVDQWGKAPTTAPAEGLPDEQQQTDLAGALREVRRQFGAEALTGVIVLSDGRNNTPLRAEDFAGELGRAGAPVCSVALGAVRPPRDAAVIEVRPPESVYAGDQVAVRAELKLDGLAGEVVKVRLLDGEKQVAEELVRVAEGADRLRKRIELVDEPKTPGRHEYRVQITAADGKPIAREAFPGNNDYPFSVTVTKDRTALLILEGRPRWEFRYIKNLFDGRDRTVRLQYVLLEPDQIADQPPRPQVYASASRPLGQNEATAPPRTLEEWLKFDAIILGDVDPKQLGAEGISALRKFVVDRGGTLILVAGPRFLPQRYGDTDLRDLLPVELVQPRQGADLMPSGDAAYRIALTAEGREDVILQQHPEAKENQAVWDAVPEIHWRYPGAALRDATVLAYAMPPDPPDFVPRALEGKGKPEDLDALRDFQRDRALISVRRMEPGQVMFFSFDRTWRLRYRVGDVYHHKLWGQVLRWATAAKLPEGTDLVKIGTSRRRYSPREPVRVRVKIVRPDFSPVLSDMVAVNVLRIQDADEDKKPGAGEATAPDDEAGKTTRVLRRTLDPVPGMGGIYEARLGVLPGGSYQVELDAPEAKELLQRDGVKTVRTAFSVDRAAPAEQIELAPDRGLLGRLATLSGGIMTEPPQAYELLDVLGKEPRVDPRRRQYPLWDSWPLLVLIVLIATVEWLLRKKVGLA